VTVIAAGLGEGRNTRGSASTGGSSGSSYSSAGSGAAASQSVSTPDPASAVSAGVGADSAAAGSESAAPWYADAPSAEVGSAQASRSSSEGFSADPIAPVAGHGTFAGSDAAIATSGSPHAAALSAPVTDDRPAAAEVVAVSYSAEAYEVSQHEAPRPDRVPATATNAPDSSAFRTAHAETVANTTKTFDVPASRRRPVVFEEDDDLDVPDFLK